MVYSASLQILLREVRMEIRLINILLRPYYSIRNSWNFWYYILNYRARMLYKKHAPRLSPVQQRIVADMRKDGIAFSTLEELFPGKGVLRTLQEWTKEAKHAGENELEHKKNYLRPLWSIGATFDLNHPFLSLSLSSEILGIVNSYDNMFRRLNSLHYAETLPVGDNEPIRSQRWHRDPQEKKQVKFFLYVNDVDEEAGPFMYVRGSQYGDPRYGSLFPQHLPFGVYPPDNVVERWVRTEDIVTALGSAGTVIFCDTSGLHRGGYARRRSRFMFTALYPSMWWTEKPRFRIAPEVRAQLKYPAAQFAIANVP